MNPTLEPSKNVLEYGQLLNYIEYHERQGYSSKQIVQFLKQNCNKYIHQGGA